MTDWVKAKGSYHGVHCPVCDSRDPADGQIKRGCEWTDCTAEHLEGAKYVVCRFKSAGSFKQEWNSRFGKWFYHHIIDRATARHLPETKFDKTPRAAPAVVNEVYDLLLTGRLSPRHEAYIESRSRWAQAREFRYTTLSALMENRSRVAQEIAARLDPAGVPGFWRDWNGRARLEGPSGVLLPVRNASGQVTGCQVNVDRVISLHLLYTAKGRPVPDADLPKLKGKYMWLSSVPDLRKGKNGNAYVYRQTGVGATASLHYPRPFVSDPTMCEPVDTSRLLVEGIMKSDTVALLWDGPEHVQGNPGGSTCHQEIAKLSAESYEFLIGNDPDWRTNQSFRAATESLIRHISLYRTLAGVYVLDWPREYGKGLDDLLLGGRGRSDVTRIPAADWLREFKERAA